eukprot:6855951-Lingulodinium_polyedra.AAC.1
MARLSRRTAAEVSRAWAAPAWVHCPRRGASCCQLARARVPCTRGRSQDCRLPCLVERSGTGFPAP